MRIERKKKEATRFSICNEIRLKWKRVQAENTNRKIETVAQNKMATKEWVKETEIRGNIEKENAVWMCVCLCDCWLYINCRSLVKCKH